jgi:hypothetical protein
VSARGPLAVGDRVRRLRGRQTPGTVLRIVREQPYQVVEVSWDLVAHPFDRAVMPASQLRHLSEDQPSSVNARPFNIGDRVERLMMKRNPPRGTVVRIIQSNPQIVAVSWDSDTAPPVITPERSQRLRLISQEPSPGHQG